MIALLDAFAELLRGCDREAHLDLSAFELPGDLEARIPEDRRAAARLIFTAHSIQLAKEQTCDYEKQLVENARRFSASRRA